MKNTVHATIAAAVCASLVATLAPGWAQAQEAQAEPQVNPQLSFNLAVVSDYRYRGISQTRLDPALQGGADYTDTRTGLYAGAWASTIRWTRDAGGGGRAELDLYGGKRGDIGNGVSYDVGVLGYVYAGNSLDDVDGFADANTAELYGQLGYGPAYIKYSHAVTNLFGFTDSRNSGYLDIGVNIPLGQGWTSNLHAGRQDIRNHDEASYTDWKIGVSRDFGVLNAALAVIGTNADERAYASPVNGKFTGKTAVVLTVGKVF
jgi:uncharacterized protein (TIGR02001 family)